MLPFRSKKKVVATLHITKTKKVTKKWSIPSTQPKLGWPYKTSSLPKVTLSVNHTSDVTLASIAKDLQNIRSEMQFMQGWIA